MLISELQRKIAALYLERDGQRGVDGTFLWFIEEIGELARAIKADDLAGMEGEFADVAAWLVSLAELKGIDLEEAVRKKYGDGCPKCGAEPCACPPR